MKTKLSSYPWRSCLLCILLLLFFLLMLIARIQHNDIFERGEFKRLLLEPLINLIILSALLFWTFTWSRVEFDGENLYIRRFRNKRETIPFEQLVYLSDLMPYSLSPGFIFVYTLRYKTDQRAVKKVRWRRQVWNFTYDNTIERFMDMVRIKNPSFILKV